MTIVNALISVSDKQGIVSFAQELQKLGVNIISSGGTAKTLKVNNIKCREISDLTGFPEILDGRVKTLHPKVHGGILAMRSKAGHLEELKKHGIEPIDLVVVNLYPFENTAAKATSKIISQDIIENIDIGGVALLRAAAKNYHDVLVVCDPNDYTLVLDAVKNKMVDPELKLSCAAKAFRHTAYYDSLISNFLSKDKFPTELTIPLKRADNLRYGENPYQEAAIYRLGLTPETSSVVTAKLLQGKEMSYNNYLDADAAWRLIHEFDKPACAIIKHNNPCGCAIGKDIVDAYKRALACDTASAFGGIIAFNRIVDDTTADEVIKLFTECVIAPAFTPKAKEVLATKKNLRLLEQPNLPTTEPMLEYRTIAGGMLIQDRDSRLLAEEKVITKRAPTDEEKASLLFAWKICKHVKSNAIVLVRGTQTVGVGAGQMSRIDSLKIAAEKMKSVTHGLDEKSNPLVLASDAFFPFNDVVNESAKIGVTAIIQPGGSVRDPDSITAADSHDMAMEFTGMRHFKH